MKKQQEKIIEKKVEAKVEKKLRKEMEKEVKVEVKEIVDKEVEAKVERRLYEILYGRVRGHASRFGSEFKKQIVVAVSAALGFLVALSWREPIKEGLELIIKKMGIGSAIYFQFLSAILITLIAVLILMIVSKWRSEN